MESLEARPFGSWKRHARTALATVFLIAGLGWVLHAGGLPLVVSMESLRQVQPVYFACFLLGMALHMILRLARYHFLIAPVAPIALRRILTINSIGLALITFLPFRLGEMARPALLREKGRLSAWAVVGTVGAERILDGVLFSGMLLFGLALAEPLSPAPRYIGQLPVPTSLVPEAARVAALVFGVAFAGMAAFYRFRSAALRISERLLRGSPRLSRKVAEVVERVSEGLGFLVNLRQTSAYLGVSVVSIGIQVLAIQLLARAVGIPELTYVQTMVVLGILALGFTVPNAPGFFGTMQLALYAGLAAYVAPAKVASEGAVLVFIYYLTHLGLIVSFAALALALEYATARTRTPAGSPVATR